jgi:hypothetical protein
MVVTTAVVMATVVMMTDGDDRWVHQGRKEGGKEGKKVKEGRNEGKKGRR